MLLMFEKDIRSGITQAIHIYAAANNKYMGIDIFRINWIVI